MNSQPPPATGDQSVSSATHPSSELLSRLHECTQLFELIDDLGEIGTFYLHLDTRPSVGARRRACSPALRHIFEVADSDPALELIARFVPDHSSPYLSEAHLGDSGRIRQIVMNLVGNAIKFTRKGEVEFFATSFEGQVKLVRPRSIIALTESEDKKAAESCQWAGLDAYLPRPLNVQKLKALLAGLR